MQFLKTNNLLSTLYRIQLPKNGKAILFADFDGTYMPFSHEAICSGRTNFPKEDFSRYFGMFSDFLKANSKNIELIVTTGRNLPKFVSFIEHVRLNEAYMPLPRKIIVNNGGDIYQSINPDSFFKGGNLGYTNANPEAQQKRSEIKELTGWDGADVKNRLLAVLNAFDFQILEVPINEFSETYGDLSLSHYLGKYGLDSDSSKFASIQDDGLLGFHIAFCREMNYDEECLKAICNEINESFEGKISYSSQTLLFDWQAGYGASIRLLPCIAGKPLNKLYDVKAALSKILSNNSNDLIIVAGDGENDASMLSPESYSEIKCENKPLLGIQIIKN